MRDDFAIFIVTNRRIDDQATYQYLKRNHYNGKFYFVLDSLDEKIRDFKETFGAGKVLIYNKSEYEKETDTMLGFKIMNSSVYAYNSVIDFAKEKRLNYFVISDDDISNFVFRYPENGVLKNTKVRDINNLLSASIEFMEKADMSFFGPTRDGAYVGGIQAFFKKPITWNVSQFIICKTENVIKFRGGLNCDQITMQDAMITGKPVFRSKLISINSPKPEELSGGIDEAYKQDSNWYNRSFLSVLSHPSNSKINVREDGTFKDYIFQDNLIPKIISDRYKK